MKRKEKHMERIFRAILLMVLILGCLPLVYSQKKKDSPAKVKQSLAEGDKHFGNQEYYLAAQKYQNVLQAAPDNNYALFRLAESARMYFNYEDAERYYSQLLNKDGNKEYPLAAFWHALMLKLNGKYEEAQKALQEYINHPAYVAADANQYLESAKKELEGCKLALMEMKKPQKDYEFVDLPSPVNTSYSEYTPVIYENDSSIVIASSRKESTGEDIYGTLGGEFSDNYRFEKSGSGWSQKSDEDQFSKLQSKVNESPGSFTGDKKKFYFTSCDQVVEVEGVLVHECAIYVSTLTEGKWGKPVLLNEQVNMKGQWNAQPDISPNGDTLFFVSKRPGGQGMHDIWMSVSSGKEDWGPAVNLGPEVNTPFIDMSPSYYAKEKTLFFASNGREGFGGLDIYLAKGAGFREIRNAGVPFNSNRDDFYFTLGENKGFLSSNRTGGAGNDDIFWFNIKGKECVIASINKDSLGDAKSISVVGKLKAKDTNLPASDLEVLLKDTQGNLLKKTHTDETGLFRLENLSPESYKVLLEDFDPRLAFEVQYIVEHVQVKKSAQVSSRKIFENIYFDFDKFSLRPEAQKALDDLVEYCKANPEIQIEMNANTDAYGSDDYNVSLSEKRGQAAFNYLREKGVKQSALVINAKGEGKPIAPNENPAGRQLNRRVEFYIVGGPGYEAKAMAYVIEPKTTLYSLAKKFNMTVEELKALNGLNDEKIEAYRPLRVRRAGDEDIIAPSTISFVKSDAPLNQQVPETEIKAPEVSEAGNHKKEDKKHKAPASRPMRETDDPKQAHKRPAKASSGHGKNSAENYYIVKHGEGLFSIATSYGMTIEELKELNGLSGNELKAGQRLRVKDKTKEDPSAFYIVKNGETLFSIARKFGITVDDLKLLNNLQDDVVYEDMMLRIRK